MHRLASLRPGNVTRHVAWGLGVARAVAGVLLVLFAAGVVRAADEAGIAFFETSIRPLLVTHCYSCHGGEKQESDLRLDTYAGMTTGGLAGPAIVAGEPKQSLLLTAVEYGDPTLQMPPEGKLTKQQIADLRRWIEMGAPHPDATGVTRPQVQKVDYEAARQFWAFQPVRRPALPDTVRDPWVQTPVDAFVLAELNARGLKPIERADRRMLIRRVTFDLLGLPPTPEEVEAFVQDPSPDAFEKVVERLLASPRYGERWGRHWLDVARYADSNGLDENIAHGNAWRYRDYVIACLNEDLPFDRFIVEQLAGDLLNQSEQAASVTAAEPAQQTSGAADPSATAGDVAAGADGAATAAAATALTAGSNEQLRHRRLVATGFLSLGPKVLAEVDAKKMEMDIIDEQVSTVGASLLGLTLGCARCHDHKFDPISTRDYYALAGILKSTQTMDSFKIIAKWHENEIATPEQRAAKAAHDDRVSKQKAEITQVETRAKEAIAATLAAGEELPKDVESRFPEETKQQLATLRAALKELEAAAPVLPTAMGVQEGTIADTAIHVRGSHLTLADTVPRGTPAILTSSPSAISHSTSGRLELARWLVAPENPLTSRVLVNRVWRWHFGRGLVESTDNFGKLGERPSHPQLLDWLASQMIESGWSLKELHRVIVLSSTYQLAGRNSAEQLAADPENRWYWRSSLRRLESESIRDSLLTVGGLLDQKMGGSMLHVGNREFLFNHTSKDNTKYDSRRRSIYLPIVRNHLYDMFQLFDYSDASVPNGNRHSSIVAPQALFMLNSDLMLQAADGLAERVLKVEGDQTRIHRLYALALGRQPTDSEVAITESYLREIRQMPVAVKQAEAGQLSQQSVEPSSSANPAQPVAVQTAVVASQGGADEKPASGTEASSTDTPASQPAESATASSQPDAESVGTMSELEIWSSLGQALLASNEFIYVQ